MNDDGEVEALRSLVSLPLITQRQIVGMLLAKRIDQVDVFFFRMVTVLPLRTAWIADILSQASLRDVPRQRCWKRGTCSGDGQSLWDCCTARLSDLSVPLTGEVRRSPELSARPSAAADSEERQSVRRAYSRRALDICFLPSCAMHKDNAVGNVVAETGRDLVFMTSARLSDLSEPLKGEVRRSPEQSAWQPIARSGKFVRRAYSGRALGCEETTVLCFLPSWSTLLFEKGLGEEGRFDVASRSETPKTSCQNHKQQLLRPRSGPSKAAPEQPGRKNSIKKVINPLSAKQSFQLWYPGGQRLKVISFSWFWVKSPSKCFSNAEPTTIIASRDEKRCNASVQWTRLVYSRSLRLGDQHRKCHGWLLFFAVPNLHPHQRAAVQPHAGKQRIAKR